MYWKHHLSLRWIHKVHTLKDTAPAPTSTAPPRGLAFSVKVLPCTVYAALASKYRAPPLASAVLPVKVLSAIAAAPAEAMAPPVDAVCAATGNAGNES